MTASARPPSRPSQGRTKKVYGKKKHYNRSKKIYRSSTAPSNNTTSSTTRKMTLTIVAFSILFTLVGASAEVFSYFIRKYQISNFYSYLAKNHEVRARRTWAEENARFSDRMFYRLFRMTRPCFRKLCKKIEKAVGEKTFKSEQYLENLKRQGGQSTKEASMHHACRDEWIPGEVKVAISLRILAGASYLDMFLWFNINTDYVREISKKVNREWFCNDDVMSINFYRKVLQDSSTIDDIRHTFSITSDGIMAGCIGALDGWLVRIKCPDKNDEVPNPGKYFSRKGFYAINVQAIVDKKKRILWRYIGSKGSSHDSPCFNESGLGQHLMLITQSLYERGFYIVGDSAYSLKGFLLTPYDNALPNSHEDSFNYFLSRMRIYVECTFGEVDRRWGIFWRPLEGSLEQHKYTIDAALRLHNYIVDEREASTTTSTGMDQESTRTRRERDELDHACDDFRRANPFTPTGVFDEDDEVERRRVGRPSNIELDERQRGKALRDQLRDLLWRRGLSRPAGIGGMISQRDRHNREVKVDNLV